MRSKERTSKITVARTPKQQEDVEQGPFYSMLMERFVQSFSPEHQPVAVNVFREKEAEYKGWDNNIEREARLQVEQMVAQKDTCKVAAQTKTEVAGAVAPEYQAPPANGAESHSELGGKNGEEELSVSLRVATPPPRPDNHDEQGDMSLSAMFERLKASVDEEDAKAALQAAIDSAGAIPPSQSNPVQKAYSSGIRRQG